MKKTNHKIVFITLFCYIFFSSCTKEAKQTLPERSWELAWSDEFNTPGAVDAAKWGFDLGGGGWGNSELQVYTNNSSNVAVNADGKLMITALSNGSGFTSARIKTKGLFSQAYGRFEARIKTPSGPGIWPAFWMLGSNIDTKPWPQCGEIDIMEQKGNLPHYLWKCAWARLF
ncbi:MAG: glycoside hydrolase family 16 protein, partial [Ferruginibacter sp.]|nr:glycoside hydrolase family 16 protein [Ferruginibacter sp.]